MQAGVVSAGCRNCPAVVAIVTTSDKEIQMSEQISMSTLQPAGVVELGTASKDTRGSSFILGILDAGGFWPLLLYVP